MELGWGCCLLPYLLPLHCLSVGHQQVGVERVQTQEEMVMGEERNGSEGPGEAGAAGDV